MENEKELVLQKIKQVFPDLDPDQEFKKLEALSTPEKYRVALAILKISQENGEKNPDRYIQSASMDYRDVLMWAEYPNEMKANARKASPEKAEEVRDKDRKQYLQWLNEKNPRQET